MTQAKHIPICPKCGYDQRGEIATWESVCPMEGQCPECGHAFAWADVLNPSLIDLGWYVEHAGSVWQMIRRTVPTLWMLVFPNRYWSRMCFETRRSLRRYVLWVCGLMLVSHVVSTVVILGANHGYMLRSNAYYTSWMNAAKTEQIRAMNQTMIIDVGTGDYWWSAIGEAVLYPMVHNSGNFSESAADIGVLGAVCFGIGLMWFIMFCLFPVTRERTKLRMVHVWRAVVVGGLLPFLVIELGRLIDGLIFIGQYWRPMSFVGMAVAPITLFVVTIWLIVWIQWFWISAVLVGWKVQARWYEMVLVTIASFLGMTLGGVFVYLFSLVSSVAGTFAVWAGI